MYGKEERLLRIQTITTNTMLPPYKKTKYGSTGRNFPWKWSIVIYKAQKEIWRMIREISGEKKEPMSVNTKNSEELWRYSEGEKNPTETETSIQQQLSWKESATCILHWRWIKGNYWTYWTYNEDSPNTFSMQPRFRQLSALGDRLWNDRRPRRISARHFTTFGRAPVAARHFSIYFVFHVASASQGAP